MIGASFGNTGITEYSESFEDENRGPTTKHDIWAAGAKYSQT